MHYTSGVWGLVSVATAESLPSGHVPWLIARILLDVAGGLFLLYLLLLSGLTVVALVTRDTSTRPVAGPPLRVRGRHRACGAR